MPTIYHWQSLLNGGHASAFALRATADKSLCPAYITSQSPPFTPRAIFAARCADWLRQY